MAETRCTSVRLASGLIVPFASLSESQQRKIHKRLRKRAAQDEHIALALKSSAQPVDEQGEPAHSILTKPEQNRVRELIRELSNVLFPGSNMLGNDVGNRAYALSAQAFELADELINRYDGTVFEVVDLLRVAFKAGQGGIACDEYEGRRMPMGEWIAAGRPYVPTINGVGAPTSMAHVEVKPPPQ